MPQSISICYFGDDSIDRAAMYLCGIMEHFGIKYEHVPSSESPASDFTRRGHTLYVLSDYPRERFLSGQMEQLVNAVSNGAGLLMLGGWESFHGRLGEYNNTPIADALPVNMSDADDRRNFFQPTILKKRNYASEHPILAGLPWHIPPCIGGINLFSPKPESKILLDAVRFDVRVSDELVDDCGKDNACELDGMPLLERVSIEHRSGDSFLFSIVETLPILVVGDYGKGKTAALATDVAPHWVGGFVDWGKKRVTQNVGSGFIEVGEFYAAFFRNLLMWTAN